MRQFALPCAGFCRSSSSSSRPVPNYLLEVCAPDSLSVSTVATTDELRHHFHVNPEARGQERVKNRHESTASQIERKQGNTGGVKATAKPCGQCTMQVSRATLTTPDDNSSPLVSIRCVEEQIQKHPILLHSSHKIIVANGKCRSNHQDRRPTPLSLVGSFDFAPGVTTETAATLTNFI